MARPRPDTLAPEALAEKQARKRVEAEKGFYGNLATYVAVISGLAVLNLLTSPEHWWFVYPMLGWGIGVASHAASVFGLPGLGQAWEERRLGELTGRGVSEARLRQVLDETLDERAVPAGAPQTVDRLQRRIEHLEAIVTSRDWDDAAALPERPRGSLSLDALDDDETPAERTARLARRVR